MKDCIFCQIVDKKIPSKIVYEDEDVIAFRDIKPIAPVHILVVPKKHIDNLASADDKDATLLGKIQLTAKDIAAGENINDGFRVSTANGKKGGQTVFHLHYHLIGGWKKIFTEIEEVKGGNKTNDI